MDSNPTGNLNNADLSDIRDAVPALDLLAIRSLKRAGFKIVRQDDHEHGPGWTPEGIKTNTAA